MSMRHPHLAAVLALPWLWLPQQADGQISAWLDFNGAIKGEATALGHVEWIEIEGFSAGSLRSVTNTGGGTTTGNPTGSEITLTKRLDSASPALFRAAATGTIPYPKATLDLNNGATALARIELENVLLAAQSTGGGSGGADRPSESITLNFTKITYTYILPDTSGLYTSYDFANTTSTTGTTPANPDTDNDGLPDAWETTFGLSVGTNDSADDPDGDGFTNLQEFQLGTNPKSGASFFKATLTMNPATPGFHQLSWNSVEGKTYIIEWSPDLVTPFTTLRTVTASATTTTEDVAKTANLGFYRVRLQ
jgi:type VI secretion system secreted protein Hcp